MRAAVAVTCLVALGTQVDAQELEPRAYGNAPVDLNFLIAGYGYTEGGVVTDPTIPLTNADIAIHGAVLAYARSFGISGRSARFDTVLPFASVSGTADVAGQPRERDISGAGDPRFRVSVNLYGAPALSLQQFGTYRQNLIVGASVLLFVPVGQYDPDKLVNIGTNRWAVKPEIGISKAAGPWTFELAAAVTLFQDNDEFFGSQTREQEGVYSLQGGIIYSLPAGNWLSIYGTYYTGGRTTVDGVDGNDLQESSRLGLTFSLPVNRQNSIKLYAHTGVSVRTGSDFDAAGVAWQYRWGGGL